MSLHAPSVVLTQPQAPYGPHIMMPGPLWVAGAKILHAKPDIDLTFQDENMHPMQTSNTEVIGITALGAPNFPEILRLQRTLRSDQKLLLGGQVIHSLGDEIRSKIFGTGIIHGNDLSALATTLQIDYCSIPTPEHTPLIPVYERISDDDMQTYLTEMVDGVLQPRAIAFYLSQGCGFNCDFCAAEKNKPESYRESDLMEKDLRYLMNKANEFGMLRLEMYLSNLDLFQTPQKLKEFAQIIQTLKRESPGFSFGMRGLATTIAFINCLKNHPDVVEAICDAGLHTVGFGIDGTAEVWEAMNKKHNKEENTLPAIQGCVEYGIIPEVLMVIGHPQETKEGMQTAFQVTKKLAEEYGAATRPHVWKPLPGSKVWEEFARKPIMNLMMKHPISYTAMDVLCAPSPVSHEDEEKRSFVSHQNDKYHALPSNRTADIQPSGWWLNPKQQEEVRDGNYGKHDT